MLTAVATLALTLALAPSAPLRDAMEARDAFDNTRAIELLNAAVAEAGDDEAAAPLLWHLGVLLAEDRQPAAADAIFARAAATGVAPELEIEIAPRIQSSMDAAIGAVPPPREDGGEEATPEPTGPRAPESENVPPRHEKQALPTADIVVSVEKTALREPPALLLIMGGGAAAVGGVAAVAGGVVWTLGLLEHAAAMSASGQREAAAHNEASAPLQLAGQIVLAGGLLLGSAGVLAVFAGQE